MDERNRKPMREVENKPLQQHDVSCRTCRTCGHRNGGMQYGKCMLSGYYISTERKTPTVCGINFEGWIPRHKRGLKQLLLSIWYGS